MAAPTPRRAKSNMLTLIIGSGLAAVIAALSSYANQAAEVGKNADAARCSMAGAILQDDTLSPYLSQAERGNLLRLAVARAKRCMEIPK